MESDDEAAPPLDLLLVGPETEGGGHAVLRRRDDRLEVGEVRSMREGQPLGSGELVRLRRRGEHERLFDVEVLADLREETPDGDERSGPAQVATAAYRAGWDKTFGNN